MNRTFRIFTYIFATIGLILILGYTAVRFGFTKTEGVIDIQRDYFKNQIKNTDDNVWQIGEEWQILREAIKKDAKIINRVSKEIGVKSRIIVSILIVEQLRLFYSNREVFKQIFSPLQILGNQSQFSWGVMGIKRNTAIDLEENLKDIQSPWYLGKDYEHVLDFKTDDTDNERFDRLTDEKDRYYSYLYTALYIKQIEKQWKSAGFDIGDRTDILATLFNIGFEKSKPHDRPLSGGAEIIISKTTYSFGGLAKSFYDSRELIEEFNK